MHGPLNIKFPEHLFIEKSNLTKFLAKGERERVYVCVCMCVSVSRGGKSLIE